MDTNTYWHVDREKFKEQILQYPLNDLTFELTERCNNQCKHCYIITNANENLQKKQRELSSEEIKGLLIEAKILGCQRVHFTGGEPFLRPDFEEIYLVACKLGYIIDITTNGTLISDPIIQVLKQHPPTGIFRISLYGLTPETYGAVTQQEINFDRVLEGLEKLNDHSIQFDIQFVLLPLNKTDLPKVEALEKKYAFLNKIHYTFELYLNKNLFENQNREIRELRFSSFEKLQFIEDLMPYYYDDLKRLLKTYKPTNASKAFRCGAGNGSFTVDPYGNLQACLFLKKEDMVLSLKHRSLRDGINQLGTLCTTMTYESSDYHQRCGKCFLSSYCEQCPAVCWIETGRMDVPPEYFCGFSHQLAMKMGLLDKNEKAWGIEAYEQRIQRLKNPPQ